MKFFQTYILNILEYDFINKFNYKNISEIPNIEKIILCFEYKNPNYRNILNSLLALELISKTKGSILTLRKSNVSLRLRSGSPVGCKVVLRNSKMLDFIANLSLFLIPKDKYFKDSFTVKSSDQNLSFDFKSLFLFNELNNDYNVLRDLSNLSIVMITKSKNYQEFLFLLKSLKIKIS